MTDIQEAIRAEVRAQVRALLPAEVDRVLKQRDAEAEKEHMTVKQAAAFIGMSVSWLEKARYPKGPKRHKQGGAVKFHRSEVIAWQRGTLEPRR